MYHALIEANDGLFKDKILSRSLETSDIDSLKLHAEKALPGLKEVEVTNALIMNSDALLERSMLDSAGTSELARQTVAPTDERCMLLNCSSMAVVCRLKVSSGPGAHWPLLLPSSFFTCPSTLAPTQFRRASHTRHPFWLPTFSMGRHRGIYDTSKHLKHLSRNRRLSRPGEL